MKRFLRRFQKLENFPKDSLKQEETKRSRRFDCLEIGEKKIEFTITDRITQSEQAPAGMVYYILCPYCGKDNASDAPVCKYCHHNLQTKFSAAYQEKARLLIKCDSCGAMSLKERSDCWACGKNFFQKSAQPNAEDKNVITLNIDGKEYSSTDKNLPLEIRVLMERVRRQGYSKELIEKWLEGKNKKNAERNTDIQTRLSEITNGLIWRIAGVVLILIYIMFQSRACFRISGGL